MSRQLLASTYRLNIPFKIWGQWVMHGNFIKLFHGKSYGSSKRSPVFLQNFTVIVITVLQFRRPAYHQATRTYTELAIIIRVEQKLEAGLPAVSVSPWGGKEMSGNHQNSSMYSKTDLMESKPWVIIILGKISTIRVPTRWEKGMLYGVA